VQLAQRRQTTLSLRYCIIAACGASLISHIHPFGQWLEHPSFHRHEFVAILHLNNSTYKSS
jgi:hypothetical protein